MLTLSKLTEGGYIKDWSISNTGHTFAGMIVSFLLVSRINTALGRYRTCRAHIGTMYRETRELTQTMACMSRQSQTNVDDKSKEWRNELAYRTLCMLRTSMAVVRYNKDRRPAWEVSCLSGKELEYATPDHTFERHAQVDRSRRADSMKVPARLAYLVRETICSQIDRLQNPLPVPKELKLLGTVDSFLKGYYGIRTFITTPVPFPLIQMTRTIVLFYIFTVPFVLLTDYDDAGSDTTNPRPTIEHCIVIFLLTYGFMGLEIVSVELDDPFGDDANDFE